MSFRARMRRLDGNVRSEMITIRDKTMGYYGGHRCCECGDYVEPEVLEGGTRIFDSRCAKCAPKNASTKKGPANGRKQRRTVRPRRTAERRTGG